MGEKEEYRLLALDLSLSNSGVSVFSFDGYPEHICSVATDPKTERSIRLKFIGDEIEKITDKYYISEVAIEKSFTRYNKSSQALFQVQGVILYILYRLPIFFYESSSVKKIITGSGNASKIEVQRAILEKYPKIHFDDFDQSDSVAVGLMHLIEKGILKNRGGK